MSAESIRIINAAISRNNGNTITSVDDGTKEALLFNLNYESTVKDALTGPAWKFGRKEELMTALPDAPVDTDWETALQLPSDVLMLRTVIKDGQPIDYVIGPDATVLCNESEDVYAVYTYRVAEDAWPADFTEGVTLMCEEIYLKSDERAAEAKLRREQAEAKFKTARRTHAQEEAPRDPFVYPLIAARRTGNAPRRM